MHNPSFALFSHAPRPLAPSAPCPLRRVAEAAPSTSWRRPKLGRKLSRRLRPPTLVLAIGVACSVCVLRTSRGAPPAPPDEASEQAASRPASLSLEVASPTSTGSSPAFNGALAYEHLKALCALGPRVSGSPGMLRQQELLQAHFTSLGARVRLQQVPSRRHPLTREPTPLANLIVEWQPEAKQRILLCAHYDTRPLPERDPDPRERKKGVFLGANDGASGVALLMELGRCLASSQGGAPLSATRLGVDFVFFDAEEFAVGDRINDYFLGSKHFARNYRQEPPAHRYVAGVLLDMVGDANLMIQKEQFSVNWNDTRPIVEEIWDVARRLNVAEFVNEVGQTPIQDDHLPLRQIGAIPVCDVIDFQYPDVSHRFWHTTKDVAENCSAESLGKVGRVMDQWLKERR